MYKKLNPEIHFPDGCVAADCRQCGDLVESLEPSRCFYCLAVLCWTCWEKTYGSCRGCEADLKREKRKLAAQIKEGEHKRPSGRPKAMKDCPHCGNRFGARVFRMHKPICAKVKANPDEAMV